jgi:hypothetical protein
VPLVDLDSSVPPLLVEKNWCSLARQSSGRLDEFGLFLAHLGLLLQTIQKTFKCGSFR